MSEENKAFNEEELIFEEASSNAGVQEMGHLKRFMGVFNNPAEVFNDVARAPKILIPLLLVMAMMTLVSFLNFDMIKDLTRQSLITTYQTQGLPVPLDGFEAMSTTAAYFGIGVAGLSVGLATFIGALITHGLATFFGAEGNVRKIFSAYLYAYIITLLGALFIALLNMTLKIDLLSLSPAVMLDSSQATSPLFTLLSQFDIFRIWRLGVMVIAVKTVENLSTQKSAIIVGIVFVLGLLLQIVPLLMQG